MKNSSNPVRDHGFHVKSAIGFMPVTADRFPAPKKAISHEEKVNSWSNFHV